MMLCSILIGGFSCDRERQNAPEIIVDRKSHDLGSTYGPVFLSEVFRCLNKGNQELRLKKAVPFCGALTEVSWAESVIAPGESTEVTVKGFIVGEAGSRKFFACLKTNDPTNPRVFFHLTATCLGTVSFSPGIATLGKASPGEDGPKPRIMKVLCNSKDFDIEKVVSTHPAIQVKVLEGRETDINGVPGKEFLVQASFEPTGAARKLSEFIEVYPNHPSGLPLKSSVEAVVLPDIELSPVSVALAERRPGHSFCESIILRSRTDRPFAIQNVNSEPAQGATFRVAVTPDLSAVAANYKIEVSGMTPAERGPHEIGGLRLRTDAGDGGMEFLIPLTAYMD